MTPEDFKQLNDSLHSYEMLMYAIEACDAATVAAAACCDGKLNGLPIVLLTADKRVTPASWLGDSSLEDHWREAICKCIEDFAADVKADLTKRMKEIDVSDVLRKVK
jgi:hypothetical protein